VQTIERVADEAASVGVARRAMQPAPAKPSTLMHRRRRSQGECAVAPVDVQALDGKIYVPVPAVPSQHQSPPYEIGGSRQWHSPWWCIRRKVRVERQRVDLRIARPRTHGRGAGRVGLGSPVSRYTRKGHRTTLKDG
jgi:hypothetical protein